MAGPQGVVDNRELFKQLLGVVIRSEFRPVALNDGLIEEVHRCCRHATADTVNRTTVRLIFAVRYVIVATAGQGDQVYGDLGQAVAETELALQQVQLREVVTQDRTRCPIGGVAQRLLCHVRVAVVVTANPRSHANRWISRQLVAAELTQVLDDVSVNLWHSFQQRKLVVAKTNLDLVANIRAVHANQSRLPQRQDTAADIGINLSESVCGTRIYRGRLNLVAAPHCGRDVLLHIEHCATTSFRWVCGQNRDDLYVVHHVRNRAAGNLGVAKLLPCCL